jgi:hypothetical protein
MAEGNKNFEAALYRQASEGTSNIKDKPTNDQFLTTNSGFHREP